MADSVYDSKVAYSKLVDVESSGRMELNKSASAETLNTPVVNTVKTLTVHLASTQPIKVKTVRECLSGTNKEVNVISHMVKSEVGEQPIGIDEIRDGAIFRIDNVPFLPTISLESGLVPYEDTYAEMTYCVVRTNLGIFQAFSEPYVLDKNWAPLKTWLSLSPVERNATTLGSILHKENPKVDPNNWYNRYGHMYGALAKAWSHAVAADNAMTCIEPKVCKHNNVPFVDIQHNLLHDSQKIPDIVSKLLERLMFNTIVVSESRGFLLAGPFMKPGIKVVLARKPNKLPGEVVSMEYKKEYGVDTICIQKDSITEDDSVVILDDVLATGGTANAINDLVETLGGKVVCYAFIYAIAEENPDTLGSSVKLLNNEFDSSKIRFCRTQLKDDFTSKKLAEWSNSFIEKKHYTKFDVVSIVPPSLSSSFVSPNNPLPIKWDKYYTCSNIQFDPSNLAGKKVEVYVNLLDTKETADVMGLVRILHRKDVDPKDITIYVPFMDTATQDRIEYNPPYETLAMLDTTAKLFNGFKVITYDLHALQSQFMFTDLRNHSIVKELWDAYIKFYPNAIPVFPDEGSMKRFSKLLNITKCVTYHKKRVGDKRVVATDDTIEPKARFVIIDDLVRSGSTMKAVRIHLTEHGAQYVNALFAHAPFEPAACTNLEYFDDIWTSNSCPANVPTEYIMFRF